MDILRKELNEIYVSQHLEDEILTPTDVDRCLTLGESAMTIGDGCAVITDAASDNCYLFIGSLGKLLGIVADSPYRCEYNSSDEDAIYARIDPRDLVEKRMLEYEFFKYINGLSGDEKKGYQATCRLRMQADEKVFVVTNTTQVVCPSPRGKIWLILCTYHLDSDQKWRGDIAPAIKNNHNGEIIELQFNERKKHIISDREKEIMRLIKDGYASKQIADKLSISIHTVNRHRQNIIDKLSVSNSIEAITAAEAMGLL